MITGELAGRAQELAAARTPFVVATVIRARRPTSVRPGDVAVVLADGTIDGFVGGACAETSVRLHALRVLETGEPLLLRLVPGEGSAENAEGEEGAVVERNPCLSGGALEIFLEPQLPAPRLIVVGEAPVARALEELACAAGFGVSRCGADEAAARSGDAAVVVASHGSGEERVLAEALSQGVPYVGLVASRRRGEAVRESLDLPDELRAQLHTPAGLDIGARGPAEIAVSILAEIVADRHATAHANGGAPAAAQSATDPVCGMQVALTDATAHLDLPGGRVHFCSEHCRASYAAEHAANAG